MGQIIVAKEKHGDYFYDASTPEAWAKSALDILTRRDQDGYWYHDPDKSWKETQKYQPEVCLDLVLGDKWPGWEDVAKLNEALKEHRTAIQEKYADDSEVLQMKLRKLDSGIKELKEELRDRKWWKEMREVVDTQDLSMITYKSGRTEPRAWYFLYERSDCEYEGVSLEDLK